MTNSTGLAAYDPITGMQRWELSGASNAAVVSPDRLVIGDAQGRPTARIGWSTPPPAPRSANRSRAS